MGKKRKQAGPSGSSDAKRAKLEEVCSDVPPARQAEPGATASAASTPQEGAADAGLELAVKALRWLASPRDGEVHAALLEASRPLVQARASRYEEDAKATKMADIAAGNTGKGKVAQLGKRRPPVPAAAPEKAEEAPALEGHEVATVAKVFKSLAANPEELMSKACKPLRAALHPLVEAHLREEKASPAFRVTSMLGARARWASALTLLMEMRAMDQSKKPKLGAYQRWVRELGVAAGEPAELAVLDAIMRLAAGLRASRAPSPQVGQLQLLPAFQPPVAEASSQATPSSAAPPEEPKQLSMVGRLVSLITGRRAEAAEAKAQAESQFGPSSWFVLAHEAAHERSPPNHFDLDIYMCADGVLPLTAPAIPAQRHEVPGVSGAFVLSDLLSSDECASIREASESIGYRPDVPLSSQPDERAQNVVLMATEKQNDALFARVKHLLPQEFGQDRLFGINRRWRLYRYNEGNVYRKHLDGAWPASGVREEQGRKEYLYDAYGGGTRSRLTFIVYLNDDFEGGETTFFVPQPSLEGALESRPVRPRVGCATVFPHGDTGVPLLHEGSSVTKGTKYLLRTDVVYASPETPAAVKHAKKLRGLARQLGGLGGQDLMEEHPEAKAKDGPKPKPPQKEAKKKRKVVKTNLKEGGKQYGLKYKGGKKPPNEPPAGRGKAAKMAKPLAHSKGGKSKRGSKR